MKMNTCKTVPAGEFKQKCLALMNEVSSRGIELVITKHGTPICKLTALPEVSERPRFGWLKGSVVVHGDLTKPVGDEWEANN